MKQLLKVHAQMSAEELAQFLMDFPTCFLSAEPITQQKRKSRKITTPSTLLVFRKDVKTARISEQIGTLAAKQFGRPFTRVELGEAMIPNFKDAGFKEASISPSISHMLKIGIIAKKQESLK